MNQETTFTPPRSKGLIFQTTCVLAFAGLSTLALIFSARQQIGAYAMLLLLAAVICFIPLPLLGYQAYALIRARYWLDRDGVHLRWGMRAEDIPLASVEWVRPADELPVGIPAPWLRMPGAWLGDVTVEGLGPVEFMAAGPTGLLLLATPYKIFAISPEQSQEFLSAFQYAFEMGSLQPISQQSVLPAAYLAQVWSDRVARWMLITSLVMTLLLFVGISLAIPGRQQVSLGFYPNGQPLPDVPAAQALLLPVLALLFYGIDLAAGLFFYRQPAYRALGYLVWASSIATSLLLAGAAVWLL